MIDMLFDQHQQYFFILHGYINILIIQIYLILFSPVYVIIYYDVRKPMIVMFSVSSHYDCFCERYYHLSLSL